MAIQIEQGQVITRDELLRQIIILQYSRNDIEFKPGSFRVKGDVIEIHETGEQRILKISFWGNTIETISYNQYKDNLFNQLPAQYVDFYRVFPATHWISTQEKIEGMMPSIERELEERIVYFKKHNKLIEAQRIEERVRYDLEMLKEVGFTKGIENYSRYLAGRKRGEPPYTLIDYFIEKNTDYLMLIDESHITLPQIRGMYNGDAARKRNLIEFGFRLPSAADNRPLRFHEFEEKISSAIYVSATPSQYELMQSSGGEIDAIADLRDNTKSHANIVEQIIRPTGLLEPKVTIRPTDNQIEDVLEEIGKRVAQNQRVLVLTLTKKMAESLDDFMQDRDIKSAYIHSEIDTLERPEILQKLREGIYDVLVGINLLREGLDLPEVALVAILDADKEGFLRNETSLIQTIGRAARNVNGEVILYANKMTKSIQSAIKETDRRRDIQLKFNLENEITPEGIKKDIKTAIVVDKKQELQKKKLESIMPEEKEFVIEELQKRMNEAVKNLDFEQAAELRDQIKILEK